MVRSKYNVEEVKSKMYCIDSSVQIDSRKNERENADGVKIRKQGKQRSWARNSQREQQHC